MSRTACSFSMLWINRPVLGFFSTAGEAGFFSPEGFALELSQPVVPFVFSKGLEGC